MLVGVDGKAPKPSMLRQVRNKMPFRGKLKADSSPSIEDPAFLDLGAVPTLEPPLPPVSVIAQRTRARARN